MSEPVTSADPAVGEVSPATGGTEMSAARTALVALVVTAALAFAARRAVDVLVVVAVVQGLFVLTWVFGAAVTSRPREPLLEPGPTFPVDGVRDPVDAGGDDAAEFDRLADLPTIAGSMPGRLGALVIGAAAAVSADIAVSVWPHSDLSPILGILGLAVPAMFAHQLTRGVVRTRVVESLAGIAVVIVAVVAMTAFVQLRHEVGGGHMVAAAALASGVAVVIGLVGDLAWSRPRFDPEVPRGLTAAIVATVAGAAAGAFELRHLDQFSTSRAVLYCAAIAAASALVGVATSLIGYSSSLDLPVARRARLLRPIALAVLPIMLVAPGAYVLLLSA